MVLQIHLRLFVGNILRMGCIGTKVRKENAVTRQKNLNLFLLEVTKSLFQDIVNIDMVIIKIMNYAQRLVDADRASLFLVDRRKMELYARIFDVGRVNKSDMELSSVVSPDTTLAEIRFSMDKGIAGYVATTGKGLNIANAYHDKRFNPEVDLQTGYKTTSVLCMPIFINDTVIGVAQMVNKHGGTFTKADEEAFEMFAVYCGLALHHAKLYEKIKKSEQRLRVALDVLSYHNQATAEELKELRKKTIPLFIPFIAQYKFSPWAVSDDDKPVYCLYMLKKLYVTQKYDLEDLMRFVLTVRKNYRNVPYHNWYHAFSVAHSMFTLLLTNQHNISAIESVAIFVACLCHDIDHRGKNNQFMVQTESPLAAIYTTSTMEHHHFNQTVTILQNEGHNIFKYLSSNEYKAVLTSIRQNILATDLAIFFKTKAQLEKILSTTTGFNWETIYHRNVIMAVMMTSCDLCAMYKPWNIQQSLVYIMMEEFWQQGDEEKKSGLTPLPMMDRFKKDELPAMEVGFIQVICMPCYELLCKVMPETRPMLEGCSANLKRWKKLAEDMDMRKGTEV